MKILGLSAFHRDSAAALVVDGVPVAAAREAVFTGKPHDGALPLRAARACLARAGLAPRELDRVVFYEKPLLRFERTLVSTLRTFPAGGRSFAREAMLWLGDRLWLKGRLSDEFSVPPARVRFVGHLTSHAACAYHLSPFEEAAVLVVDDVGEWATTAIGHGEGSQLKLLEEVLRPHSLGLAVATLARFLGLDPETDGRLLFDLARHGRPRFRAGLEELLPPAEDGAPQVDASLQDRHALERRFGPPRVPGTPLRATGEDTRDADLAASLQLVLVERLLALAHRAARTGSERLCLGGLLAQDRRLVSELAERGPFRELFVPPDPGEAGAALGAALTVHAAEAGACRARGGALALGEPLGPRVERPSEEPSDGARTLLPELLAGRPVGWVRGPLDAADVSLGARLALADPSRPQAASTLLGALQRSEPFLTCRLALPAERVSEWVDVPPGTQAVLTTARLAPRALPTLARAAPAAVGPDGRVWLQAIERERDPQLHDLLRCVGAERPAPALLLTSLQLRGGVEPRSVPDVLAILDKSQLAAILVEDQWITAPEHTLQP